MYPRHIEPELRAALADTPVVLLTGARQTGKTTLARALARESGMAYATLDDALAASAAEADPVGFLAGLGASAVIDEVQKAPGLFPAIKRLVDEDRRPGRFLLTGSTHALLLPRLSESLAGRMEIVTLWPLSQGELSNHREAFIDHLFEEAPLTTTGGELADLPERLAAGGYPEPLERPPGKRRDAWFEAYVTTILQRDIRELSRIEGLAELPRLLGLLAARTANLLNVSELSRASGLPQSTLKRYLGLLEATFLVQKLPAWSSNLGKRLVKSPKIHLVDSGLALHLAGLTAERLAASPGLLGPFLETWVVGELRKQAGWADHRVRLHHYRTATGREVDIVLEDRAGSIVGIEVKAAATATRKDFAGLESLAQAAGRHFRRGILLYRGRETVPVTPRLSAVPLNALWQT